MVFSSGRQSYKSVFVIPGQFFTMVMAVPSQVTV